MAETSAPSIRFTAPVRSVEDRLILRFPDPASARLSSRGQVAASVTLDDRPAVTTVVEPDGRKGHWLPVDELADGFAPGDEVEVVVEPTKEWPEPDLPEDFATALDGAPDIADVWSSITPMARWEWVRWVNATKNLDTRARRVEVAIDKMRSGKRRPCCFDLSSCTVPEVAKSGKLIEV